MEDSFLSSHLISLKEPFLVLFILYPFMYNRLSSSSELYFLVRPLCFNAPFLLSVLFVIHASLEKKDKKCWSVSGFLTLLSLIFCSEQ